MKKMMKAEVCSYGEEVLSLFVGVCMFLCGGFMAGNGKREKEMDSISEFIRVYKGMVGSGFKGATVYVGVHMFGTREDACVLCW